MLIKICGITKLDDALLCCDLGADMIGLNFYHASSRYIDPSKAARVISKVKGRIKTVGIFVNPTKEYLQEVISLTGIDIVQLHGDESPNFCIRLGLPIIKAISLKNENDLRKIDRYQASQILIDNASGGSGKLANLQLSIKAAAKTRAILAGGLSSDNVTKMINLVKPIGVDVASALEESPGIKSHAKITSFIKQIRENNYE
jgi:phosphoribosylanthranilate isomerase